MKKMILLFLTMILGGVYPAVYAYTPNSTDLLLITKFSKNINQMTTQQRRETKAKLRDVYKQTNNGTRANYIVEKIILQLNVPLKQHGSAEIKNNKPDLTIKSIVYNKTSDELQFTITTLNGPFQGYVRLRVYAHGTNKDRTARVYIKKIEKNETSIISVPSGAFHLIRGKTYKIDARIDPTGLIVEDNEMNNTASESISIQQYYYQGE